MQLHKQNLCKKFLTHLKSTRDVGMERAQVSRPPKISIKRKYAFFEAESALCLEDKKPSIIGLDRALMR